MKALLKFTSILISYFNHIILVMMTTLIASCASNQEETLSKIKISEAEQELKMIHNLEYAYFLQNSIYSSDFEELNYIPQKSLMNGGTGLYEVSILESTSEGFKARAQAVQDFDGDGQFNIWEIDQDGLLKEIQPD